VDSPFLNLQAEAADAAVRDASPDAAPSPRAQRIKLAGLETIVGLHLGVGHSLVVQRLDPKLKRLNLTAKQVTIMWLVEANPEITQIEIARFLGLERATIYQFVRSLMRHDMIRVEQSATDGRSSRMELTAKGRESLAHAREIIVAHETETIARLTPIERRLLLDLLHKLVGTPANA
jgi:DNA-binding MarR family transcriptional regulator